MKDFRFRLLTSYCYIYKTFEKMFNTVPLLLFSAHFSNNVVTRAGIVYNQTKHIILRKIKRKFIHLQILGHLHQNRQTFNHDGPLWLA